MANIDDNLSRADRTVDFESRTPEEIEAEIARRRAEMGETIEAIQRKLSPGPIMDEAVGYLRDGGGAEFMANLGRSARNNPVPAALIGIGIAWLMLGGDRPASYLRSQGSGRRTEGATGGEAFVGDLEADADVYGDRYTSGSVGDYRAGYDESGSAAYAAGVQAGDMGGAYRTGEDETGSRSLGERIQGVGYVLGQAAHIAGTGAHRAVDAASGVAGAVGRTGSLLADAAGSTMRNPLPAVLIGAGVAWMLLNGRSRNSGSQGDAYATGGRYVSGTGDIYAGGAYTVERDMDEETGHSSLSERAREVGQAASRGVGRAAHVAGSGVHRAAEAASGVASAVGQVGGTLADVAGSAASVVADTARRAIHAVTEAASWAGDGVSNLGNRMGSAMSDMSHRAGNISSGAYDRAGGLASQSRNYAGSMKGRVKRTSREQPFLVGVIGFAVGVIAAMALPMTRRENELMGEVRDQTLNRAKELGREGIERAKDVATSAVDAAREEADRQGLTLSGGEDAVQNVAEKVRAVAGAATSAVREEGDRSNLASNS